MLLVKEVPFHKISLSCPIALKSAYDWNMREWHWMINTTAISRSAFSNFDRDLKQYRNIHAWCQYAPVFSVLFRGYLEQMCLQMKQWNPYAKNDPLQQSQKKVLENASQITENFGSTWTIYINPIHFRHTDVYLMSIRAPFQYLIRRLIVRSREVPKSRICI